MSVFQRIHDAYSRRFASAVGTAFGPITYSKAWILTAILLVAVASLGFSQSDPLVVSPDGSVAVNAPLAVNGPLTVDGHMTLNANGVSIDLVEYLVPVGSVQPFAGAVAPTGWALCDGHAVLRTEHQYDRLYAVIGAAFGNGATDGNGNPASGYFNVPDLREAAPVGIGTRGVGAAAHDAYALGQFKDDQLQNHTHAIPFGAGGTGAWAHGSGTGQYSPSGTATGRVGTVTHGKQIGLNYIIKL